MSTTHRRFSTSRKLEAVSHPARLAIVGIIASAGENGIRSGEIARCAGLALPATSNHLSILAHAGLVTPERNGRNVTYRVVLAELDGLVDRLVAGLGIRRVRQWATVNDRSGNSTARNSQAPTKPVPGQEAYLRAVHGWRYDAGPGAPTNLLAFRMDDARWTPPANATIRSAALASSVVVRSAA